MASRTGQMAGAKLPEARSEPHLTNQSVPHGVKLPTVELLATERLALWAVAYRGNITASHVARCSAPTLCATIITKSRAVGRPIAFCRSRTAGGNYIHAVPARTAHHRASHVSDADRVQKETEAQHSARDRRHGRLAERWTGRRPASGCPPPCREGVVRRPDCAQRLRADAARLARMGCRGGAAPSWPHGGEAGRARGGSADGD
jgi:hypothetical protein